MKALMKIASVGLIVLGRECLRPANPADYAPPKAPAPATPAAKAPAKATPQSEAGEPRANTSRPATPQTEAGEPRANTSRPAAAPRSASGPGQKAPGSTDRLELGTATVTGDREQPKVMYIVPWKKSDIGDLAGKPHE